MGFPHTREGARGFQGDREHSARCENQESLGLGALEVVEGKGMRPVLQEVQVVLTKVRQ